MNEFQCVVVRSPIGCVGVRDEWGDDPIEWQGFLQRIVVFEREKTRRTPRVRRPARKRSEGPWVCSSLSGYPRPGRPSHLQTHRPTDLPTYRPTNLPTSLEEEPHTEPR